MTPLSKFDEFAPGMGFPSVKDSIVNGDYVGKARIIEYLKNGRVKAVSAGFGRDVFTGAMIPGTQTIYTDGMFMWNSTLTYHVEKYNLKLPDTFVNHVMGAET